MMIAMRSLFLLPAILSLSLSQSAVPQVQVVPEGLKSVNGSVANMSCVVDLFNDTICGSPGSYLVDGSSPLIDTNSPDWASRLVTVKRIERDPGIYIPHVLLTFGFDTAVPLSGIEMDLFICPDWNISAPYVTAYLNEEYNLTFTPELQFITGKPSSQSSCDSLSTLTISGDGLSSSYRTVHVLVDFLNDPSIKWVFIGEIKFLAGPRISKTVSTEVKSTSDSINTTAIVAAVSLILIGTFVAIIAVQCVFIARKGRRGKTAKENDVPVSSNEAYAMSSLKRTEEAIYEVISK